MARPRVQSFGEGPNKLPHTVSLKVLRLTRPSFTSNYVHPQTDGSSETLIDNRASLAYPTADPSNTFILSPALTLPESFRSAYVGESFSCAICANNELSPEDKWRRIDDIKIQAEIQSPSNNAGKPVELESHDGDGEKSVDKLSNQNAVAPGGSLQKILRINLQEEGNHVLAITVTYNETLLGATGAAGGGKIRTFRKLYQFVAQNLVGVRTKAGDFLLQENGKRSCAVEAQLENLGERIISLEAVNLTARPPFVAKSINWDLYGNGGDIVHAPVLNPRDVLQVAFLVEHEGHEGADVQILEELRVPDGKVVLGQMNIQWRGAMGDRGSLSTGWLLGKK